MPPKPEQLLKTQVSRLQQSNVALLELLASRGLAVEADLALRKLGIQTGESISEIHQARLELSTVKKELEGAQETVRDYWNQITALKEQLKNAPPPIQQVVS